MYETIQKAWSCSYWQLVANTLGFSQVQSMCGVIATRSKASNRYAGNPWPKCNQERRHINSTKADGSKRLDKPQQPKRRNERAGKLWAYRKDKARKSSRLQSVRDNTLSPELRHEQAGRVIGELQENRLHGRKYSACSASIGEQSGQVETAKKINFRCPIGGRSIRTLSPKGTNSNFKSVEFGHFVPSRYKNPTFAWLDCPPTGHLYRLTIYMQFLGAYL